MTESQRPSILRPEESYTFRRYFELHFNPVDILLTQDTLLYRVPTDLMAIVCILAGTLTPRLE